MDAADSNPKTLYPQPKESVICLCRTPVRGRVKKISHKAPKVKAVHKDDAPPETEEMDALNTCLRVQIHRTQAGIEEWYNPPACRATAQARHRRPVCSACTGRTPKYSTKTMLLPNWLRGSLRLEKWLFVA